MAEDKKDDDSYKGPGKFTAALGRAEAEGIAVAVVTAAAGAAIGAAFKNKELGRGATAMTGAMIGASVGLIAGEGHGAYVGAKNAGAAEEQVKNLVEQRDGAVSEAEVQRKFVKLLEEQKESTKGQTPSGQTRT